jgi:hypothetical protein
LQSEAFNTTWAVNGIVVTANSAANPLTGTTTADTITADAANNFHLITQSITYSANENTVSIYVKANGYSWFLIDPSITNAFGYFNVTTGAVGTKGSACTTSISNVGGGWYRCSVTFTPSAGAAICNFSIRDADNGGAFLGDGVSGFFIFGAQAETGVATDYIPTTTAAVSVGPVSGLPRLDYLGSTCPRLLLEPQRTNLALYSEQLNNAAWAATRAAFTANQTVAPDGYTSADLYTDGTFTGNVSFIEQSVVVGGSGTTYSVFVKKGTANFVQFGFYDTDFHGFVVNTTTWATTHTFGSASSFTATNYGNGWYRLSMYKAAASNTIFVSVAVAANSTGANYNGTGALTAYFWGAQIEAANSTYPTSYIPTLGASVTRVADAASKTGISSLIGQTEGTIFWEGSINTLGSSAQICDLNADGNKYIQIYNSLSGSTPTIGLYIQNVSVLLNIGNIATLTYNTNFKFALGYKNNDYAAYLNGVQVYVNTTIGVPPTSNFGLGKVEQAAEESGKKVSQAILFKTRLTNAQLAELTA